MFAAQVVEESGHAEENKLARLQLVYKYLSHFPIAFNSIARLDLLCRRLGGNQLLTKSGKYGSTFSEIGRIVGPSLHVGTVVDDLDGPLQHAWLKTAQLPLGGRQR